MGSLNFFIYFFISSITIVLILLFILQIQFFLFQFFFQINTFRFNSFYLNSFFFFQIQISFFKLLYFNSFFSNCLFYTFCFTFLKMVILKELPFLNSIFFSYYGKTSRTILRRTGKTKEPNHLRIDHREARRKGYVILFQFII